MSWGRGGWCRSELAGIKKLIAVLRSHMAILTSDRSIIFLVTPHAVLMKSTLKTGLFNMVQVDILFKISQIFSTEPLSRMTIPAGDEIRFSAAGMTSDADRVDNRCAKRMMMADRAFIFIEQAHMHFMIKLDWFIVLSK